MQTINAKRKTRKDIGSWAQRIYDQVISTKEGCSVNLPHPTDNRKLIKLELSLLDFRSSDSVRRVI